MHDVPRWVFDTNVMVSGLLSPNGPPGRLLDMLLGQTLRMVFDDRIAAEYRDVIARPKFRIAPSRAAALLAILQFQDLVSAVPWRHAAPPDPDDVMFLEAAVHATDHVLVTGNTRHYPASCCGPVKILTPRDAWKRLKDTD